MFVNVNAFAMDHLDKNNINGKSKMYFYLFLMKMKSLLHIAVKLKFIVKINNKLDL